MACGRPVACWMALVGNDMVPANIQGPPMQLNDWTLWAAAQEVIKRCGVKAPEYASTQIAEAQTAGDDACARTWREIAQRIDQLMDERTGRPLDKQ